MGGAGEARGKRIPSSWGGVERVGSGATHHQPKPNSTRGWMDGWMDDARIGGLIYSTGCEVVEERTGVEDAPALVDPKPTRT